MSVTKFADHLTVSIYEVQSDPGVDAFRHFVDPMNGNRVEVTKDNVSSLRQLCREFGFWKFSSILSDFRITELETLFTDENETFERRIVALNNETARPK
jgi:hypothetical protein